MLKCACQEDLESDLAPGRDLPARGIRHLIVWHNDNTYRVRPQEGRSMILPGKYDEFAQRILEETAADSVLVFVIRGTRGNEFSVKSREDSVGSLPFLLRTMANDLENAERNDSSCPGGAG